MLEGMKEPYRKASSESILTASLAGDIARCLLKRRQRHRWAGLLSCEKPVDQDADFIPRRRKATQQPRYKSRMRRRARTDLRGGRSAMIVPTATVIHCLAWQFRNATME